MRQGHVHRKCFESQERSERIKTEIKAAGAREGPSRVSHPWAGGGGWVRETQIGPAYGWLKAAEGRACGYLLIADSW